MKYSFPLSCVVPTTSTIVTGVPSAKACKFEVVILTGLVVVILLILLLTPPTSAVNVNLFALFLVIWILDPAASSISFVLPLTLVKRKVVEAVGTSSV